MMSEVLWERTEVFDAEDGSEIAVRVCVHQEGSRLYLRTNVRQPGQAEFNRATEDVRMIYDPKPTGPGIHRLMSNGWQTFELVFATLADKKPPTRHVAYAGPEHTHTLCGREIMRRPGLGRTDTVGMVDCTVCEDILLGRSK